MTTAEALADRLYGDDPISDTDRHRLSRLLQAVASSYRFSVDSPDDAILQAAAWASVVEKFASDFTNSAVTS